MYAIIQTGGKQYKVSPGDLVDVEKLEAEVGQRVEIIQVLIVSSEDGVKVGTPTLRGAKVIAQVVRHGRGPKIRVFKKKRRKGYRKTIGHRQWFTTLRIEEVQV
jgi:large subunit ribosomal protein L21